MSMFLHVGKGIPNVVMHQDNRTAKILPSMSQALRKQCLNSMVCVGELTLIPVFGEDPLPAALETIRQEEFLRKYPDLSVIFSSAVNGEERPFRDGLQYMLSITKRLARSRSVIMNIMQGTLCIYLSILLLMSSCTCSVYVFSAKHACYSPIYS